MFNDNRNKEMVFVAHCVLNQNSISDGTAEFSSTVQPILNYLLNQDIGIVQLPCPELHCLGLDRGNPNGSDSEVLIENTRIRSALEEKETYRKLQSLVKQTIHQISEYIKHDFKILGVIGINRSPSCGVETTSYKNQEANGEGIFISLLKKESQNKGIHLKMIGIKTLNIEEALTKISLLIK